MYVSGLYIKPYILLSLLLFILGESQKETAMTPKGRAGHLHNLGSDTAAQCSTSLIFKTGSHLGDARLNSPNSKVPENPSASLIQEKLENKAMR